jgi:hypothetical protein
MLSSRPGKTQFTEVEAAEELGISVLQLRQLIRSHVVESEEDLRNVPIAQFQVSDLLLLRLLTGRMNPATAATTVAQ